MDGNKRYEVCPGLLLRREVNNGAEVTVFDKHQVGLDHIHYVPSGTVYLTQVRGVALARASKVYLDLDEDSEHLLG